MSKFKDMAIENGDQQENEEKLIDKNLDMVEKLLKSQKLFSQLNSVIAARNLASVAIRLLKEIENIVMSYYPQDKEFTDIQSALVYLLEKRVEEIQNLAVKCDTLQEQLDMFKNGGVI